MQRTASIISNQYTSTLNTTKKIYKGNFKYRQRGKEYFSSKNLTTILQFTLNLEIKKNVKRKN